MQDQERFTSPWAVEMADEEKFERTVATLGRLLRDDVQLQALYHMLVMMSPSSRNSEKTRVSTEHYNYTVNVQLLFVHENIIH